MDKTDLPSDFEFNGKIHRFGEKKTKWAVGYEFEDKNWTLKLGDWKTNEKFEDSSINKFTATKKQIGNFERAEKELDEVYRKERTAKSLNCALESREIFSNLKAADKSNFYIVNKKIKTYNFKMTENKTLVIPVKNKYLDIIGLQYITHDKKWYSTGVKMSGALFNFGKIEGDIIYLCEGVATGATIHEASGKPVICAFTASNLVNVIKIIRNISKSSTIIICADNDKLNKQTNYRTGQYYAELAKKNDGNAIIIYPSDNLDEICDFNDIGEEKTRQRLKKDSSGLVEIMADSGFTFENDEGKQVRDYEGLRLFFTRKYKYFYIPEIKATYIWTGTHYKKTDNDIYKNFAEKYFNPIPKERERIEFKSHCMANSYTTTEKLTSTNSDFINFKNCVLNWKTRETFEHDPKFNFFHIIPHDYNKDAACPTWDKMLNNIVQTEEEMDAIEQFGGFALSKMSYEKNHKALICLGSGRNGKSTVLNIMGEVIGKKNTSQTSIYDASTSRFGLSNIEKSLLNISEEEDIRAFKNARMIKQLASNSPIEIEHKHEPKYSIQNYSKLVFTFNELPKTKEFNTGFFRRFIYVNFPFDLKKEPQRSIDNIYTIIKDEYSGIINRFLSGLDMINSNNGELLELTNTVKMQNKIKEDSDPIYNWIDNSINITNNPDDKVLSATLYSDYLNYLGNPRYVDSLRVFSKKLSSITGLTPSRITNNTRGYKGLEMVI